MELPPFIPIFPLPNVVFFPEVPLPLHVFEDRYRTMVRDALAGQRIIGVVLLRGDWEVDYFGTPDVYRVGCAGRIVEATELPDGKFNIVLAGLREFEVLSEQRERSYRQASVAWRPAVVPSDDPLPADFRARLMATVERFAGPEDAAAVRQLIEDTRVGDDVLVNFLAFWLDLPPIEKQLLLEADVADRAPRLIEVVEFHLQVGGRGGSAGGSEPVH